MIALFQAMWRRQKRFVHGIIYWQNWILMAVVYVVAVTPVALMMRLFRKPMLDVTLPDRQKKSYWSERTEGPMTWERARRRF